jgi:hypothetical protein
VQAQREHDVRSSDFLARRLGGDAGVADELLLELIERRIAGDRRVSAQACQRVSVTKGDLQMLGEVKDAFSARSSWLRLRR